jgi:RNA polymerase sigma-70 factor (ECF subfamily)
VVRPTWDGTTDEELLRRFGEGDPRAFEELMRRYQRPIYNFILRSVRDPEQASELVQETFLRVVQRSGDFLGGSKVSTWMYTIARNLCIDNSRKMVFRRHRSLDAPMGSDEGEGRSMLDTVAATTAGADREAIGTDIKARLVAAVDELPDEQREVFLLRELQNLAFKDIAEIIGVPENTVKSRMRYALERLQRALSEYEDYVKELAR